MRKIVFATDISVVVAAFCFSMQALAQTAGVPLAIDDRAATSENGNGNAVIEEKRDTHDDSNKVDVFADRKKMDFMLKPGSGWITQGVPPVAAGFPTAVTFGVLTFMMLASPPPFSPPRPIIYIPFLAGVVSTVGGAGMLEYGRYLNNKFERGFIDYRSPALGYQIGGSINILYGASGIAGGVVLLKKNNDKSTGIVVTSLGGAYAIYGLSFIIYGALNDFERKAGRQAHLTKLLGTMTPFVGCTGGMCDGNTRQTTGRETYFAGIRGEF